MFDLNTLLVLVACLFVILIAVLFLVENRTWRALKAMDELDTQVAMVLIDLDYLKNMQLDVVRQMKAMVKTTDEHTEMKQRLMKQAAEEELLAAKRTAGAQAAQTVRTMRGDISIADYPPPFKQTELHFTGRYEGDRDHG